MSPLTHMCRDCRRLGISVLMSSSGAYKLSSSRGAKRASQLLGGIGGRQSAVLRCISPSVPRVGRTSLLLGGIRGSWFTTELECGPSFPELIGDMVDMLSPKWLECFSAACSRGRLMAGEAVLLYVGGDAVALCFHGQAPLVGGSAITALRITVVREGGLEVQGVPNVEWFDLSDAACPRKAFCVRVPIPVACSIS